MGVCECVYKYVLLRICRCAIHSRRAKFLNYNCTVSNHKLHSTLCSISLRFQLIFIVSNKYADLLWTLTVDGIELEKRVYNALAFCVCVLSRALFRFATVTTAVHFSDDMEVSHDFSEKILYSIEMKRFFSYPYHCIQIIRKTIYCI